MRKSLKISEKLAYVLVGGIKENARVVHLTNVHLEQNHPAEVFIQCRVVALFYLCIQIYPYFSIDERLISHELSICVCSSCFSRVAGSIDSQHGLRLSSRTGWLSSTHLNEP